jgi:hypothetical protein
VFWLCSAKVEINPEDRVFLGCGSGSHVEPDTLLDGLEANIILVWNEDKSSKVVLISIDSLFLGSEVVEGVLSSISGMFDVDEIFLAASHTHSAPMIDETKPQLGKRNDSYAALLVARISQAVSRMYSEIPVAVTLRKYQSNLGGIVQRRNKRIFELSRFGLRWGPTLARPNLRRGAVGANATIAEFADFSGVVIAALAVVPCHPVAMIGKETISSDYVGGIRAGFRREISASQETPFVFLQGASGDLVPWWRPNWLGGGPIKIIDQIVNGVQFPHPAFTIEALGVWCKLRLEEILSDRDKNLKLVNSEQQNHTVRSGFFGLPLAKILKEAEGLEKRQLSVHRIEIGNLRIVGVSAEVSSRFKEEIQGILGDFELVGCIRDTFGYAVSTQQYREGGYEVEGHQLHFSIKHAEGQNPGLLLRGAIENLNRQI